MLESDDGSKGKEVETSQYFGFFENSSMAPIQKTLDKEPAPDSLFHYTSAAGLLGILGDHKLRFSDASFCNDGSESVYGVSLVSESLDRFTKDMEPELKIGAERLKDEVAHAMAFFQPVVFCMSSENNLLNQWRDYGNDVVPYSIEFDPGALCAWKDFNFPVYLSRVVYDLAEQIPLINEMIASMFNKAKHLFGIELTDVEQADVYKSAATELCWLVCRFKNRAFSAEKEWRLISHLPDLRQQREASYRTSSLGVVPYYEYFKPDPEARLPVRSVTVGPSPYAEVSLAALNRFLFDKRYPVLSQYSTIPIRP